VIGVKVALRPSDVCAALVEVICDDTEIGSVDTTIVVGISGEWTTAKEQARFECFNDNPGKGSMTVPRWWFGWKTSGHVHL